MRRARRSVAIAAAAAGAAIAALCPAPSAANGAVPVGHRPSARILYTRELGPGEVDIDATPPFDAPSATPIMGNFTGAGYADGTYTDIFWYDPGPGGDQLWSTTGDRHWAVTRFDIVGDYIPIVGRFAGNDLKDDILWYAPGPAPDELWDFEPNDQMTIRKVNIDGTYTPIVGHFTGWPDDDIFWYAPGKAADHLWDFDWDGHYVDRPERVVGTYTPIVGRFGPSSAYESDDIFWYAPGKVDDHLWDFDPNAVVTDTRTSVNGTYTPMVGNFFGYTQTDQYQDILWYGPGTDPDFLWNVTDAGLVRTSRDLTIDGTYDPQAAYLLGHPEQAITDVLWFGAGAAPDLIWDFSDGSGTWIERPITLDGDRPPALGSFEAHQVDEPDGSVWWSRAADIIDVHS